MPQQPEIQNKSSNEQLLEVTSKLLEQSGIDKDDFFAAISALHTEDKIPTRLTLRR